MLEKSCDGLDVFVRSMGALEDVPVPICVALDVESPQILTNAAGRIALDVARRQSVQAVLQSAVRENRCVGPVDLESGDGLPTSYRIVAVPLPHGTEGPLGAVAALLPTGPASLGDDPHDKARLRLQRLFDANIIGILTATLNDGRILEANDEFLRMIGYTRDEFRSKAIEWRAITPREWDAADNHGIEELRRFGVCKPFEKEYYRKDGSRVPFLIGASLIPGTEDEEIAYTLDLTELKASQRELERAHALLARSELELRALTGAVPVITWMATADGWLDWYSDKWYEYTGQTREEAVGWGWQNAHHPDDFPKVMQEWPKAVATGEPFEMEFRLRRADGQFRWFLTRAHPVLDAAGEIVRWYGSNVDIEEQRQLLEQSRQVAATLQGSFLPHPFPTVPRLQFDALYQAAESGIQVGGDWYDVFSLPDERTAITVGDVAGHGLQASIVASHVRQTLFALSLTVSTPGELMRLADRALALQHPGTIVTAAVGFIAANRSSAEFAIAGHPPPLVVEADGTLRRMSPAGLPLGVAEEFQGESQRIDLRPGTMFLLYTDGLVEFGRNMSAAESALEEAFRRVALDRGITRPAVFVRETVLRGAVPPDDIAILTVEVADAPRPSHDNIAMPFRKTWRFHSSDAHIVSTSRRELMSFIVEHAASLEETGPAELILGELLANTLEHARGLVEVEIDWTDEQPLLNVRDRGPGFRSTAGRQPTDIWSEKGRGLYLIRSFAQELAIDPRPGGGTELRCVLPIRKKSAPQSGTELTASDGMLTAGGSQGTSQGDGTS